MLPDVSAARSVTDQEYFEVDYTLFLNLGFAVMSLGFVAWKAATTGLEMSGSDQLSERILFWLAMLAFVWLVGGVTLASGS
jgi:hypothetical protein